MANSLNVRRMALLALGLAAIAGCNWLVPQSLQLDKFYIQDYSLDVTPMPTTATVATAFEQQEKAEIQGTGEAGMVYTPDYQFTANPVVNFAMTVPINPSGAPTTTETDVIDGQPVTQTVLVNAIAFIDTATVSYSVTGFNIPPQTLMLNVPVRNAYFPIHLPGAATVTLLEAAFAKPATTAPISGTMTVTLSGRDLDPFASQRNFTVTKTIPLDYDYSPANASGLISTPSPLPTLQPASAPPPASASAPVPTPSST